MNDSLKNPDLLKLYKPISKVDIFKHNIFKTYFKYIQKSILVFKCNP